MGTVVAFLSIFLLVLALVKDLTAKRDDTGRAWRRPAALAALIFVVGVGVEVGKRHIDAEHEESEKVLQAQTKTDLLNAISQTMQAVELLSAQVAGKPNATVANIAPQLSHIRQVLQSTNDAVSTGSADRAVLRRAQESLTQIQQSISEIGNTLRERRAAETAPSGASPLEHRAPTIPSESSRVPQDLSTNRTLIGLVAAGESSSPTSGRTEGLPTTSALIAPPAPATPHRTAKTQAILLDSSRR
jgi:hypothetical protein